MLAALLPCRVWRRMHNATEHADFGSRLAMFMSLYVAMRAAVTDTRAPGAWPNHSMLAGRGGGWGGGIVWCATLWRGDTAVADATYERCIVLL